MIRYRRFVASAIPLALICGAPLAAAQAGDTETGPTTGDGQPFDPDNLPPVSYPALAATADTMFDFIPEGWAMESQKQGDLNNDGKDDFAAILRMRDPVNMVTGPWLGEPFDTNPRLLLVAFRERDGLFRRVVANHVLIPRRDNPMQEDPLREIAIKRGVLTLTLENFMNAGGWGTWNATYAFRWQAPHFALIGYDRHYLARNSGESEDISVNYLTHRRKTVKGRADEDGEAVSWSTEARRAPITLEGIGNAMQWHPDYPDGYPDGNTP